MKLFYRKFGQGPPLIILHGVLGISDNWVTMGKQLGEHHTVYIPDQRNHGQSPHSNTFNYYALMDDLAEFIETHQLKNPIIMGHSMGGKVAMHFALEYPQWVQRLIVVDMSVRAYSERTVHRRIIQAMESVNFNHLTTRKAIGEKLQEQLPEDRLRLFVMKNLYRPTPGQMAWRINLQGISENMENILEGLNHQGQYNGPALFVRGGASDYIANEDFDAITALFPQASVQTIAGASHWVHADAPEALCEILNHFLGEAC